MRCFRSAYSASQNNYKKVARFVININCQGVKKIGVQLGTTGDTFMSKIAGAFQTQFQNCRVFYIGIARKIEAVI